MESVVRDEIVAAMAARGRAVRRRGTGLVAVSAIGGSAARHRVVELTAERLVIEAEGTPRLGGWIDILRDGERVIRRLAVLAWARDGMAGYEFKHGAGGEGVPADYERPEHAALLPERPATD